MSISIFKIQKVYFIKWANSEISEQGNGQRVKAFNYTNDKNLCPWSHPKAAISIKESVCKI